MPEINLKATVLYFDFNINKPYVYTNVLVEDYEIKFLPLSTEGFISLNFEGANEATTLPRFNKGALVRVQNDDPRADLFFIVTSSEVTHVPTERSEPAKAYKFYVQDWRTYILKATKPEDFVSSKDMAGYRGIVKFHDCFKAIVEGIHTSTDEEKSPIHFLNSLIDKANTAITGSLAVPSVNPHAETLPIIEIHDTPVYSSGDIEKKYFVDSTYLDFQSFFHLLESLNTLVVRTSTHNGYQHGDDRILVKFHAFVPYSDDRTAEIGLDVNTATTALVGPTHEKTVHETNAVGRDFQFFTNRNNTHDDGSLWDITPYGVPISTLFKSLHSADPGKYEKEYQDKIYAAAANYPNDITARHYANYDARRAIIQEKHSSGAFVAERSVKNQYFNFFISQADYKPSELYSRITNTPQDYLRWVTSMSEFILTVFSRYIEGANIIDYKTEDFQTLTFLVSGIAGANNAGNVFKYFNKEFGFVTEVLLKKNLVSFTLRYNC